MKKYLLLVGVLLLTACGGKEAGDIDVSSQQRLTESVKKLASTMPKEEYISLMKAIAVIDVNTSKEAQGDKDKKWRLLQDKLKNKTVAEIIAEGDKITP